MLHKNKYWLLAGLWFGLILSTLTVVRVVTDFLRGHGVLRLTIGIILGAVIILMIGIAVRRLRSVPEWMLMIGILGGYAAALAMIPRPEDKFHLLQYGLLAWLLCRGFQEHTAVRFPYTCALILSAFCGWIDERVQHLLPQRYYSHEDVFWNILAAVLALGWMRLTRKPSSL